MHMVIRIYNDDDTAILSVIQNLVIEFLFVKRLLVGSVFLVNLVG